MTELVQHYKDKQKEERQVPYKKTCGKKPEGKSTGKICFSVNKNSNIKIIE